MPRLLSMNISNATTLKPLARSLFYLLITLLFVGCSATKIINDESPLKITQVYEKSSALTESKKQKWVLADPILDTLPGISHSRAIAAVGNKKPNEVVVAIIDSGVELSHPLIEPSLWVNTDEVADNGIDDDQNGYIDDIHGYNFLGESYYEQLEYVRMIAGNIGTEKDLARAKIILEKELPKATEDKRQYRRIYGLAKTAIDTLSQLLNTPSFSSADLKNYTPPTAYLAQQKALALQFLTYRDQADALLTDLKSGVDYYTERADYNLSVDFNGRAEVGDNPYDISDIGYGNSQVNPRKIEESHGTHVAGIVAQIAPFAKLMVLRTVPAGDEYDKDVALAIRYAVDNGAKIINCSFGKSFSPNKEWVEEALVYAEKKGVLVVHAAGNESEDLDVLKNTNYPDDEPSGSTELVTNFISVGALSPFMSQALIADFSNFGKKKVDLFAPGEDIYSSMPQSAYQYQGGTSMAAPVVSGVAAWIAGYFPKLNGSKIKSILKDSSLRIPGKAINPATQDVELFSSFSQTGGIVNLYNALILAQNQ